MFKSFSKSRSNRSSNSSNNSRRNSETKTELAITAPRQIVKALYPYEANGPEQLSFKKDDFFYVTDDPAGEWFVAFNPMQNTKGLVPISYFQVVQRQDTHAVPVSQANRMRPMSNKMHQKQQSVNSINHQRQKSAHLPLTIYGFVLYDFQAERNDELTVKAGESIVIVAQSTDEWFVAKPIGRLGGPGLIPVSYVELREVGTDEVLTDVHSAIKRAELPQVDEWKRKLAEYKASSIPLGQPQQQQQQQHQQQQHQQIPTAATSNAPPMATQRSPSEPYVVLANVDRFAINGGRYWYLVKVEMSNGKHRNLCRYYQDFYDFQIKLLEQFPVEAGRTGQQRTLPFMPGPLTLITHTVTSQRRANLDEYVRDLIRMPPYISQSAVVLDLFSVHPGDVESNVPTDEVPQPPEDENNINYSGDMPEDDASSENSQSLRSGQQVSPRRPDTASSSGTATTTNAPVNANATSAPAHSFASAKTNSLTPTPTPTSSKTAPFGELPEGTISTATVDEMYTQRQEYGERNASLQRPANQPSLKIKVYAHEEVFAIRVPLNSEFSEVYAKISTRLGMPEPNLYTTPDFVGEPLKNKTQFQNHLNGGSKMALYLGP